MANSSKNNNVVIIISTVAAVIILWLVIENASQRMAMNLLKKRVEEQEAFTEEIKKQLKELIQNNKGIPPLISAELTKIAAFIEIKQEESAVFNLAKIIENLLAELYKNDTILKEAVKEKKRKDPTFEDYLEYANKKGVITKEDYHLISVAKTIRNKEAHELGVKKERSRIAAVLIAGFSVILCLCALLDEKKAETILKKNTEESTINTKQNNE